MARIRKKVAEKDYADLIKRSEEKIEKLTADLKAEKATKKQLEKDKAKYEMQKAAEEEAQKKAEIVDMLASSGKSLDEIKSLLNSDSKSKK